MFMPVTDLTMHMSFIPPFSLSPFHPHVWLSSSSPSLLHYNSHLPHFRVYIAHICVTLALFSILVTTNDLSAFFVWSMQVLPRSFGSSFFLFFRCLLDCIS